MLMIQKILFAAADLKENEQLTLQYFPSETIAERQDSLETCELFNRIYFN